MKKVFFWDSYSPDELVIRKKYIDNAPTIEPNKIEYKAYNDGFKDDTAQGIKLSASRKGEWITKGYEPYGRCNICGEICEINNFCGYCGADMREGGKNETNQCR